MKFHNQWQSTCPPHPRDLRYSADPLNTVSDLRLIPYLQILEINPPSSLDYSSAPDPRTKHMLYPYAIKMVRKTSPDVARERK